MEHLTSKPIVAVLKEDAAGEMRVALVPAEVTKLSALDIVVEEGAGIGAGFLDEDYASAGARITSRSSAIELAELVLAVRPPAFREMREGQIVVSLGGRDSEVIADAAAAGVIHLGLERLPRITRAQSMDVLSSQAVVAGYAAVLEGTSALDIMLPMMTTAAGIIRPARVIALGAGVAGLQVLATARRLGAVTYGFDVREAAREQVESLGAEFVFPQVPKANAEGQGGYAAAQSIEQQAALRRALAEHLVPMNLIVTSAQIPGRRAPLLIDTDTLDQLRPGTVIVDMAAETGGNVAVDRDDEIVHHGRVTILRPTNLPSTVPADASRLFSGNMRSLLQHISRDGSLLLRAGDEIIDALAGDQKLPTPNTLQS